MWEGPPEPELVLAILALAVLVGGLVVAERRRPFRPSLTPQQLSALAKLSSLENDSRGMEALNGFYGWRQDQLANLARGFGAFGVTVLLAILAAMFEADKITTERAADMKTTTTTEGETSIPALFLVGVSLLLAGLAWWRQRALQREFVEDTRRLSSLLP